jgi:hypothetical protein
MNGFVDYWISESMEADNINPSIVWSQQFSFWPERGSASRSNGRRREIPDTSSQFES